MFIRKQREAQSLGLGDATSVATDYEDLQKGYMRDFKLPALKGTRKQTTVVRKQQKRQEQEERFKERAYNPRVKGLAGVPGVEVAEDGTVGLAELRQQRPDIFKLKPVPIEGAPESARSRAIYEKRMKEGRDDKYKDRFAD